MFVTLCRQICRQPTNQTAEEHMEGSKHRSGAEEREREEATGTEMIWDFITMCLLVCLFACLLVFIPEKLEVNVTAFLLFIGNV